MKVVSLDPGGTTGYAIAYIGEPKTLLFTLSNTHGEKGSCGMLLRNSNLIG